MFVVSNSLDTDVVKVHVLVYAYLYTAMVSKDTRPDAISLGSASLHDDSRIVQHVVPF